MKGGFSRATALKIAWREGKASAVKFAFVIFGVAAGVGALTGVRGFSVAFREVLLKEARTLMAADLSVRVFAQPTLAQESALNSYVQRGAELTQITETVSMMSAGKADPVLVSVKAVDPARYPFYGKVKLDPPQPLGDALRADTVAVSDDLLLRLNVDVGGEVSLGGQPFRVAAITRAEPDRMTGSLNVGPRILITREGLDRTGLMQFGSRASQRFLFKLPAQGIDLRSMQKELKAAFPEAQVVDSRETHPAITRALDRSTTFLSLVSLIALIVGALGVATAIHSHLQQKLDSIAILKCLGARSSQIVRIYVAQTAMLGLAGGVVGIALGAGVQRLFPLLIGKYFQFDRPLGWSSAFAWEGLLVGLLVTMLFTVPPLLEVRKVRPALIFRREMAEARGSWSERWKQGWPAWLAGALILSGVGAVAAWLAESVQMGLSFAGGLVASLLILSGVAWLLMRGVRLLVQRAPFRLPVTIRQGISNLYRPGNHAGSVLVALGVGVMFTLTIYLVQKSLLVEVVKTAPPGMPNVFLINITSREKDGIEEILNRQPDLPAKPRIVPLVAARLTKVNGVPLDQTQFKGFQRRFLQTRQVTWAGEEPKDLQVRKGSWWATGETAPLVCVSEDAAEALKLEPGAKLEWQSAGRDFEVKVAAVHRNQTVGMGGNNEFYFTHAALEGLPVQYFASARMKPAQVGRLQRETYLKYPTVTVINVAEVLAIVQDVVDQVALVVRFISAFAILAGAIILASTVAGTRFRRIRETAVFKALGAKRRMLAGIFSVEFLVIGTVAGAMGSGLGTLFSRLLLTKLLDAEFRFDPLPNLAAVMLTALVAVGAGWLASLRILDQKPLEVLRDE
jgi:putative ABC transport system permease protein